MTGFLTGAVEGMTGRGGDAVWGTLFGGMLLLPVGFCIGILLTVGLSLIPSRYAPSRLWELGKIGGFGRGRPFPVHGRAGL